MLSGALIGQGRDRRHTNYLTRREGQLKKCTEIATARPKNNITGTLPPDISKSASIYNLDEGFEHGPQRTRISLQIVRAACQTILLVSQHSENKLGPDASNLLLIFRIGID